MEQIEKRVRKVFLDDLPRKEGIGSNKGKQVIDWKNSIGYKVKGVYDGLNFEVEIISYNSKSYKINIKYLNEFIHEIFIDSFRKCRIGVILRNGLYKHQYNELNSNKIVDLRNLPLNRFGVDWTQVAKNHIKIPFAYDEIKGEVEVINYEFEKQLLYIKYLNRPIFKIATGNFQKCQLGKLLGKRTNEFKVELSQAFIDSKRDLIIIDKEYRKNKKGQNCKWYKYHCNKCSYEGWIEEGHLLGNKKVGCSCCAGFTIIPGINDIPTTAAWMIKYFVNPEEAKLYTKSSGQKIKVRCPDCGKIKNKKISGIYQRRSIACSCGDGFSYPEKLMNNILTLLNIKFETQVNKTYFKWCKDYKYDFYFKLNNEEYIIETHGLQHYDKDFSTCGGVTLEEQQEVDKIKKELALKNGIKEENYIIINCRKSELEWIKNSILNSRLNEIFNLNNINWLQAEEFALSNLVKKVCEIKRNNPKMSTNEIGKSINLSGTTIKRYLKKGSKLGWCEYDPKEEKLKGSSKAGKMKRKSIEIFKNNKSLGKYPSTRYLAKNSESLFSIKLLESNISTCARGETFKYKGFTFKYV